MSAHRTVYINIDPAMDLEDARKLCQRNGRRIVCRAVAKPGELQDAIMALALDGQLVFTHEELDRINGELDRCQESLADWMHGHG